MALLTLSDLNTTINHEPRVLDLRLAEALEMADLHKIRPLIDSNRAELEGYGGISARRAENTGRGRPGTEYWLNEPQALLICMFSRTPKAAEVRKALVDLFMAYRRGQVATVKPHLRAKPKSRIRPLPVWDPGKGVVTVDHIADTAMRLLLLCHALKAQGAGKLDPTAFDRARSYTVGYLEGMKRQKEQEGGK